MRAFPQRSYMDVNCETRNSGNVVWRRQTKDVGRTVRFDWRWLRHRGSAILYGEGRGQLLATDVPPRRQVTIVGRIWAPAKPRLYELSVTKICGTL